MKRRIRNPFVKLSGYNCFGCSPNNPIGLRLNFQEEGEYITTTWFPTDDYQGYHHVLHGGIQATLMDEIASWLVYIKLKKAGVTTRLSVTYHKPVYTGQGEIVMRASLAQMRRNLAEIKVELFDHQGKLCSSAIVEYFTYSETISRERFYYPDPSDFYYPEDSPQQ